MKCKSCNQDGFKNPREIVKHKTECKGIVKASSETSEEQTISQLNQVLEKSVPDIQPQITYNPVIEERIQTAWNRKLENPAINTSHILPTGEQAVVKPVEVIGPHKEVLMNIFATLKTPEGKSAISRLFVDKDVEAMEPQLLYQYLFKEISDGDERAILRTFFV